MLPQKLGLFVCAGIFMSALQPASAVELFAKGSYSKNNLSPDNYLVSLSVTTGMAITLVKQIRIEGRYTNVGSHQNRLNFVTSNFTGTLENIKTTTHILSAGIDLDILGESSSFQPYVFLGAGYIESQRTYTITANGFSEPFAESVERGVSGNLGLGFKFRLARQLAFETELYGYIRNFKDPQPLIDYFATAGIRFFI